MRKSIVQPDAVTDGLQPRQLRPLLPAQPQRPVTSDDISTEPQSCSAPSLSHRQRTGSVSKDHRPTRQQIAAACTNCQRKKCKCDGSEPCQPCQKHSLECTYTYKAGVTRSRALKRKNEALSEDNDQLRFIVAELHGGSDEEARQILKRIRESHNVDQAVSHISQASLLLPATNNSVVAPRANSSEKTWSSSLTSSSTSPSTRRAPTLDFLLNPIVDDPVDVSSHNRLMNQCSYTTNSGPIDTSARPTNDRTSSNTGTTSSSSAPSERQHSYESSDVALIQWIPYKLVQNADLQPHAAFPGTADRLNALLDGLPFLLTRPKTPSPVLDASQKDLNLPVVCVSARPWTTLTDDDEFVSQLVSLFFTWEQPWYNYVEMNSFLDDMKNGSEQWKGGLAPEREFCSPALVNAILAMGCLSSRHPGAYYAPHEVITRGRHFANEAERLIRADNFRPKLTTLLAIWLTMWYRSCSGYKFRSSEFTTAFYNMHDQLGFSGKMLRPWDYDSNTKSRLSFDSKSEIIWGIYCHDAILAISNGYPAHIKRPLIEKVFEHDMPQTSTLAASHIWWPYPELAAPQPSLRHECLVAKVYLTDIIHEVFEFLNEAPFGVLNKTHETQRVYKAMRIYSRFVAWREALPEYLGPQGSKLPHVILLRASYDVAVITLFRSLQRGTGEIGDISEQPRFKVISHSQSLMATMNSLRDNWTLFRHCYAMQTHWLTAFALLFHLRLGEPVSDVFTLAIRGLHEVGEKWVVAAWMLQIVGLMAKEFELDLPKECIRWLEIDSLVAIDENSSDVMLPVTIPEEYQLRHPLLRGSQAGTYLNDLNSVLGILQQTQMNE